MSCYWVVYNWSCTDSFGASCSNDLDHRFLQGVLALHISLPGLRPRFMLTKTLEWNLHWCILDSMFDDAFRIRPEFVNNPDALERRFKYASHPVITGDSARLAAD